MATQPQGGRYEVKVWTAAYDAETGEILDQSFIYQGRTFASFEEADAIARDVKKTGQGCCTVVLEDGLKIACHGWDVDRESACGVVTGWIICIQSKRPHHIHPGQWDSPAEEFYADTPEEWERLERQTRGKERHGYVLIEPTIGLKTTERMGSGWGKRHKYTPDFFPLGRKMVKKFCDVCSQNFWFPHGERVGDRHYDEVCERHFTPL